MTRLRLEPVIQHYDWGSTETLAELLGRAPSGRPEAELWMGAHSAAPSPLSADPAHHLGDAIAADPVGLLGGATAARFDSLPFLLKVLAVERPLSLQVHPTIEQAERGFDAEDADGVSLDDPQRNYRDRNHKPEMVVAISEFEGLCGFRPVAETARLLDQLGVIDLLRYRERLLAAGGVRDVVTEFLTLQGSRVEYLVRQIAPAAGQVCRGRGEFVGAARWIERLASRYPGDRGVLLAVLMNHVTLAPGQALFLSAGRLHAYLYGTVMEILANSDNVLRGGFTSKHVDVRELLAVLDVSTEAMAPAAVRYDDQGGQVYAGRVPDFALTRYVLSDDRAVTSKEGEPRIFFCADGSTRLAGDRLARGQAVFVGADETVVMDGSGTVFVATPNLE